MVEPGWISFYTAAAEIERRFGGSQASAQARLRSACADQHIRSMKAPYDPTQLPFEFWTRVAPSEWRSREVDHDGPDADGCEMEVMLNEDDFRHWLNGSPISKPRTITLRKRKQNMAKQAIDALWPDGIPDGIVNKEVIQKVGNWLKANGASALSPDTILRAAGRKR